MDKPVIAITCKALIVQLRDAVEDLPPVLQMQRWMIVHHPQWLVDRDVLQLIVDKRVCTSCAKWGTLMYMGK